MKTTIAGNYSTWGGVEYAKARNRWIRHYEGRKTFNTHIEEIIEKVNENINEKYDSFIEDMVMYTTLAAGMIEGAISPDQVFIRLHDDLEEGITKNIIAYIQKGETLGDEDFDILVDRVLLLLKQITSNDPEWKIADNAEKQNFVIIDTEWGGVEYAKARNKWIRYYEGRRENPKTHIEEIIEKVNENINEKYDYFIENMVRYTTLAEGMIEGAIAPDQVSIRLHDDVEEKITKNIMSYIKKGETLGDEEFDTLVDRILLLLKEITSNYPEWKIADNTVEEENRQNFVIIDTEEENNMKQPLSEEEIQSYRKYGMMVDIEEVFGKGEYGIKKTFIPPEEVDAYIEKYGCCQYNNDININNDSFYNNKGSTTSGIIYSNISNASSIYFDDKILTPRGHGFAAEHANHLKDLYQGKNAKLVGDNNAKNGADRFVDGVNIQSKYYQSGARCVEACFENGKFRYINPDGSPMQIEVPHDMHKEAVQAMRKHIEHGEVPGVSNPEEAENIIRQGHFKYQQAKNIAKAGTIDSIRYDAMSGAIIAKNAFCVTAILTYATAIWNGENIDIAIKSAIAQGIKVGGTAFITSVLAGQLSKAGLNSALVKSSEFFVNVLGPKASAVLVNAFKSGTNIYGAAAMKSASKMLRSNMITGIISFAVLSIGDIGNIFSGRISGEQLFKNMANTASTIVGGTAGWTVGASIGATIGSAIPIFGTALGAFLGGLAGSFTGGSVASSVSNAILDEFIEDDAKEMVDIIQEVFTELAEDYLISQKEAECIVEQLENKLTGNLLKDMYGSDNHRNFARKFLIEYFEDKANKREHISLPTIEQMQKGIKMVLEDVGDAS